MTTPTPIRWEINQPLVKSARVSLDGDNTRPPSHEEKQQPLKHFRAGDRIVVLYGPQGSVIATEPIQGPTVWQALESLERGLQRYVNPKDTDLRPRIEARIAQFLRAPTRQKLTQELDAGTLQFKDLLGDHTGLTSPLRRERGGVYIYGLDS